eukprot:UN34438
MQIDLLIYVFGPISFYKVHLSCLDMYNSPKDILQWHDNIDQTPMFFQHHQGPLFQIIAADFYILFCQNKKFVQIHHKSPCEFSRLFIAHIYNCVSLFNPQVVTTSIFGNTPPLEFYMFMII